MRDLPVALVLPQPLRDEVAAYVETEGGWQVVGLEGPPRPALVIADAAIAGRDCVVVLDGSPDADAVRAALQAGALDVVAWPQERGRLLRAPGLLGRAPRLAAPPVLLVGGASGGVGTSTVVLALGGLVAWAGRAALVVGGDDLLELCGRAPWRGPGATDIAALGPGEGAAEVAALARPVPGVPRLAVLGAGRDTDAPCSLDVTGWPVGLVVIDARTRLVPAPQLVCARPGPGLRRAAAVEAPVALVGAGPLDARAVRRVLGGEPAARLPASSRVARAAAAGRVPAGLPGSWLAAVRTLAGRVTPVAGGTAGGSPAAIGGG